MPVFDVSCRGERRGGSPAVVALRGRWREDVPTRAFTVVLARSDTLGVECDDR